MLNNATPRQVLTWSLRTLYVSAPLCVATLLAWGFKLIPAAQLRPQLVLMVYLLLLGMGIVSACTAGMAACQLSVQRAFAAGARAGLDLQPPHRRAPQQQTELRVVE